MKKIITMSIAAMLALGFMSFDILYDTGEPDHTGSPADGGVDCTGCHADFVVNSGGGSISIAAPSLVGGYIAGTDYTISVTVAKAGQTLFGFGFEALKSGNTDGGILSVLNSGTQLMIGAGPTNMVHANGGNAGAGTFTFTFKWTAPSTSTGTVTFYASGLAADGGGGFDADYVYTTSLAVSENLAGGSITINSWNFGNVNTPLDQNIDTLPVASIKPGNSGSNVTWDFTGLIANSTSTNTYIVPSTGLLFSSFATPVPNACISQENADYLYFDTSSTKIELLGFAGDLLQNSTAKALVFSNPETVITFPSNYNTTFSDVSAYDSKFEFNALYQGVFVDSVREKETVSISSIIDGSGIVITPGNALGYPCIRQKITKISVDSTWAKIFMGGFHYWINTSGTTSTSISYSYLSDRIAGAVVVDIKLKTDSTANTNTAISEVRWNPVSILAATISAPTNVLCFGDNSGSATVSSTGGTAPYTYLWNTTPAQTTATATGLTAGSYTVTVTDANSFTTTATVTITGPASALAAITSSTPETISGNGTATVTASGGTGPYTYSWTPGWQTTATAIGLTGGTYSVDVYDANGCINTQTVLVQTTIGIGNHANFEIAIFPNPASNSIIITNPSQEKIFSIIYDLTGREVLNSGSISGVNNKLSVLNITNGTYVLKVFNEGGLVKTNRIVVKH